MTDGEIDAILKRAAESPQDVDPALLAAINQSIGSSMRPVRPMPAGWVLVSALIVISAGIGFAGAARSGFYGFHKLSVVEIASIFSILAIFIWLAAETVAAEMIPGSRRRMPPGVLLAIASSALVSVFAVFFHDHRTERFVPQGMVCLGAGLLHAIPVGLASWWLFRRGFALNPIAAGLAIGTLSGLAGVTMLELHCANLELFHVMLWHTAVVLLSALAGAGLPWILQRRS